MELVALKLVDDVRDSVELVSVKLVLVALRLDVVSEKLVDEVCDFVELVSVKLVEVVAVALELVVVNDVELVRLCEVEVCDKDVYGVGQERVRLVVGRRGGCPGSRFRPQAKVSHRRPGF